jgi:hypothetical protein
VDEIDKAIAAQIKREQRNNWTKTAHARGVFKPGEHPYWLLFFDEHPPRSNRDGKGTFGPHAMAVRFAIQAERRRWLETTRRICETADIPFLGRIRVSSTFQRRRITYRPPVGESIFSALGRGRGADEDNDRASLKRVIDGIVAAGIVPDDNRNWIEIAPPEEQKGPKMLVVRIDPIAMEGTR